MGKQTQMLWMRHTALDYLAQIETPLSNLERLEESGRAMPYPLRRKIRSTIEKVRETAGEVRSWPITDREKFQQIADRRE